MGCPDAATDDGSRKCGWLKTQLRGLERFGRGATRDQRAHPMLHGTNEPQNRSAGSVPVLLLRTNGTVLARFFPLEL